MTSSLHAPPPPRGPTTKTLESLISINNKLQQPDAAAGVLVFAQNHHRGEFVSLLVRLVPGRQFVFVYRVY